MYCSVLASLNRGIDVHSLRASRRTALQLNVVACRRKTICLAQTINTATSVSISFSSPNSKSEMDNDHCHYLIHNFDMGRNLVSKQWLSWFLQN